MMLEQLEERRLMVSRVFLDFGNAFEAQPADDEVYGGLQVLREVNPGDLHDALVGTGVGNTLYEFFGIMAPGAEVDPPYDIVSFGDMINSFNSTLVPSNAATLALAITQQIRRALEPFDIQVISSVGGATLDDPTNYTFGGIQELDEATDLLDDNNVDGDGGAPGGGGDAAVPQFGKDDVYVFFGGIFQVFEVGDVQVAIPSLIPISSNFGVSVASGASTPDRLDTGAVIDVNYWIDRVHGGTGTGGSLNVAIANAALYAIGFGYGLPELENGKQGPFTQYFDPDTQLINQSTVMVEAGFSEAFTDYYSPTGIAHTISDTDSAFFNRFRMMQNGFDVREYLRAPTLGNPPALNIPGFPLPPPGYPDVIVDFTINTNPNVRENLYDLLANDSDIGRNPDVQYVTGTGAFDRITIKKLSKTLAQVTVSAYRDSGFKQLIETQKYNISLTKIVTPGRRDSGQPFRVIVEGCNNNDQVFIDADLGVRVVVHGGPDVERLKFTGNGSYNAHFTPDAPSPNPALDHLIPEGLLQEASGTLRITGDFGSTTVLFDNYNPMNSSAIRLENFNKVVYYSPGYLDMTLAVTIPRSGEWNIAGEVDNPILFPGALSALTGNLQFSRVKHLEIDTTLGASNDTVNFATDAVLSNGLRSVTFKAGAGIDRLTFDDSNSLANIDYFVAPTEIDYGAGVSGQFTGYAYSGVQFLTLNGTKGFNDFVVTPSKTTKYTIGGDSPPNGSPAGDTLTVRQAGTTGATQTPNGTGNGTWTFTSGHQDIIFTSIEELELPPAVVAVSGASDTGKGKPLVKVYDAATNALLYSFYAYPKSFKGGVRVAMADMDGDLVPDIVVAPGIGRSEVKVFNGDLLEAIAIADPDRFVADPSAALLDEFTPDGSSYKSGLYVALGDVDGDGDIDIATSRSKGTTRVRVFENNGAGTGFDQLASWRPYSTSVVSGASIAVADIDKDGLAEVITAPGAGAVATVRIFSGFDGFLLSKFNAFESSFRNGVSLAAGDADGDGRAEIFVGAGTGGKSRVRVFNRLGSLKNEFKAYTSGNINAPLRIAAVDPDGADRMMLFVGQGNDGDSHRIRLFDPLTGKKVDEFVELDSAFAGGVYLG